MASRGFDWGPPVESNLEFLKEWAIYGLLILLVGLAGWMLVDFRETAVDPDPESEEILTEPVSPGKTPPRPPAAVAPAAPGSGAPPTAAVTPVPRKTSYLVQLGAFGDEKEAMAAMDQLKGKGIVASLTVPDEQFEMYRLIIGPFPAEAEAETLARRLNELDFACFVVESL